MRRWKHARIVVGEDAVRRTVEIVELTLCNAPPERRADGDHQGDGQRDQEEKDVHRESASAPHTTTSEDKDMPAAATSGVTKPAAAAGIAMAL